MSKNILIDTTNNIETRIAVTENGKLDDFEIETNKPCFLVMIAN